MTENSPMRRLHATVSGRVQGVGFRHFVITQAQRQCPDIAGKVRNTYDGKVEVIAEGPEEQLQTLYAILRQGPRWSQVVDVSQQWGAARGDEGSTFTVDFSHEEWSV